MNDDLSRIWSACGQVVVSQPVHQHAYEAAVAAQQAGLLRCLVTGVYRTGRGVLSERLWRWTPRLARGRIERSLRRRWHPDLDPGLVVTMPTYQLIALAYRTVRGLPAFRRWDAERWAHERFDAAVGRWLRRGEPPAIVHAFEGSALATLRAAKEVGATTVLDVPSAHEYYVQVMLEEGGPARHVSTARVLEEREHADYLFAHSDFVRRCLLEHGVPAEKIALIPGGAHTQQFRPVRDREDGVFRVLYVGQISRRKGVQYLLEAWRRQVPPKAELVLVGGADAAGRDILRGYEGLYRWVGEVPRHEVHRWFQQSDVFVLPSLADAWGLVVSEAMASSLPVVTTSNCGAVVRDGIDGFVVPPRDVGALQEKILNLYEHPEVRREMGARGRTLVETHYTWGHYRERVGRAYKAILEGRDPREAVGAVEARVSGHSRVSRPSEGCGPARAVPAMPKERPSR